MPYRRVDVPPQKVYGDVPLLLPLMTMSDAEKIKMQGEPQIYDKDYPLDYDGLGFNPVWSANTGMGGFASFGNVAMLPSEVAQMAGLGLTPAQIANQAKRAAAQQAAAQKKATAVANRQAAVAQRQATAATKKTAKPKAASTSAPNVGTKAGCQATGGTWTPQGKICTPAGQTPPPTAAQQRATAKLQAQCQKGGGTWDIANSVCISATQQSQQQCTANGDYWNGTACIPKAQQTCVGAGNTWDVTTGVCITNPNTPKPCPTTVPVCPPGQIIGNDANGCPVICVIDQSYQNPAIAQCQQSGGQWNGSYCMPPSTNYGLPPPGAGLAPIPPGYDSGGGGGGAPMMSSGGGMPMTPGLPPGQQPGDMLNQSAGQFDPTQDQSQGDGSDQTSDGSTSDQSSDSSTDTSNSGDAAGVADNNIFESISKLFSGMNGLGCGCNNPPPWIGMNGSHGANLPMFKPQDFVTEPTLPPVQKSTTAGVILTSLVIVAGAAALFMWSKGGKK